MYDILIKNGTIFDGSGAPGIQADVALYRGRIAAIGAGLPGPAEVTIDITNHPPERAYIGQTVADVARQRGHDPFDTCLDLLVESECTTSAVLFDQHEPNVQAIMRHPRVMIGSDGSSLATSGPLSRRNTHPRAYGTFPRVLGHYTREQKLFDWPQAIYKMTGLPARAFNIKGRGRLEPQAWADVVVFDPATIIDKATFTAPHRYAAGIDHVFLNGQHVVKEGQPTGIRAGRVLSRA